MLSSLARNACRVGTSSLPRPAWVVTGRRWMTSSSKSMGTPLAVFAGRSSIAISRQVYGVLRALHGAPQQRYERLVDARRAGDDVRLSRPCLRELGHSAAGFLHQPRPGLPVPGLVDRFKVTVKTPAGRPREVELRGSEAADVAHVRHLRAEDARLLRPRARQVGEARGDEGRGEVIRGGHRKARPGRLV